MRIRILWWPLALALVAVASATASTTSQTTLPALTLAGRMPLVVRGTHFRAGERVRLTAAAGTSHAIAAATTTRRGVFVARFHYTPPLCMKLVVQATGQRGDHARLVVKPLGGPSGVPCGQ